MTKYVFGLVALLPLLFLSGCRHNKFALDTHGVPETLVIAAYEGDDPAVERKLMMDVSHYLAGQLGMKVELNLSSDYTSVVEAVLTKKAHIAYLSPFSYVLATRQQPLVPLVLMGLNGRPFMYRSLLFTSSATGLKTMDEVRARAKNLTLCFADPASTSGHLVPRAYLNSIGLDPQNAFRQVLFAGDHAASILTVKSGKVDVGCAYEYALSMLRAKGLVKKEDLVVLWTSEPMVEGPIVTRTDINKDFARKLQEAYLLMPAKAPDVWKEYVADYHLKQGNIAAYIPAMDSDYNALRRIAGTTPGMGASTPPSLH